MPSIFDSSAVLALLFNEVGADRVREELPDGFISAVTVAEILGVLVRNSMPVADAKKALAVIDLQVVEFTTAHAARSAEILTPDFWRHGISLGDRACIATSLEMNLPVVAADRKWALLNVPGLRIKSFR